MKFQFNVVADALSRMTIGSVSHVEEEKKEVVKDTRFSPNEIVECSSP